ncbi:hypothetical protein [Undibacterium sp. RuRC25W]|uniref:hypothetical protein n=1 Tax=Undibacterium sp. RuRC25W TaxID=3413047 RepID=UPI003BF339BD
MNKRVSLGMLLSVTLFVGGLSGCVKMPTEKQTIVDQRPSVSFEINSESLKTAQFFVDGQNFGTVGEFVEGVATVRILSGTHNLRVVFGDNILLNEKFYVGDGVHRSFIIK